MTAGARMLIWSIDETARFDTAWVSINGDQLAAEGWACGLLPTPYWVSYALETAAAFETRNMTVNARWEGRSATLDLRRDGRHWTVNGETRSDLDEAVDCDLAACPLTNTMPILRHELHRRQGDYSFVMAFIEVPSLQVVVSRQNYTHVRPQSGGAVVRYRSGSFESELTIDRDGFVDEYPKLGRRIEPRPSRGLKNTR